jgi:molybdopterin molybdotransferase
MTTGDEVVGVEAEPLPQQIRNSNAVLLAALVEASGGEAVVLAHAGDNREAIAAGIRAGRECELLLVSGGVSAGRYDLVEEVLADAGAEFFFTGVRMQPGRPVVFGRMRGGQYFFGLPGNPVSTHVTFLTLVRTLLRAMCGTEPRGPRMVTARLGEEVRVQAGLTRFLPARWVDGEARLIATQGSGDMAADALADGYVVVAEDVEHLAAGSAVRMLLREFC